VIGDDRDDIAQLHDLVHSLHGQRLALVQRHRR
jgi:hypothetical protein